MKKNFRKITMLSAFILAALTCNAQGGKPPFTKGSKTIGVSLGFGVEYNYYGNVVSLPAIAFTYDQGFFENVGPGTIGIGGIIGYKTAHYNYSNGDKAHWNNYIIGLRGSYHLTLLADKNNKFDPYAGVTLGLRIFDYKDDYYTGYNPYSYNTVYPIAGVFVGAKYNFTDNFGAFAELGYDISFARIGLNFNF